MLSLGKLAPGQQRYYLATVAAGAEEYYTGAKEAPGEWTGRSASRLGLVGEVDAETLHHVLESRDPWTGERLTHAQGAPKVPGFDATLSAPKSVSLLFALGDPEASNEVRNAHDAAVAAAIGVFEARAAAQLEHGAKIRSMTLDRLLRQLDQANVLRLDSNTVVVVDEASMIGTRKLARLLDHADTAGAKVVLVGDHYQLPEIDAGGAFAGLAARLSASQLLENRRQVEPWERSTLAQLRAGDADVAFASYQGHQRVLSPRRRRSTPRTVGRRLVDRPRRGFESFMLAGRNTDVDDLNGRARDRVAAAGVIGRDQLDVGGRKFAVGDEILTTRNDYRLGVLNGTRATITDIDPSAGTIYARGDAREVVLPWEYIAAGHVAHAYALTFHKAQGMTVHSAFVLADDTLDRPRAYTGLSRGTHHNALYITDPPDQRRDERHAPEPANDAVARAREGMSRMLAKSMAIDGRERITEPRTTNGVQLAPEPPGLGPDLAP